MSTQLLIPTDFILFSKLSSVNFSKSVKKRRIYDNLLCFERHPLFSKKNHSTKNLRLFHMLFDVIVSQGATACLLHIALCFSITDTKSRGKSRWIGPWWWRWNSHPKSMQTHAKTFFLCTLFCILSSCALLGTVCCHLFRLVSSIVNAASLSTPRIITDEWRRLTFKSENCKMIMSQISCERAIFIFKIGSD